ncbi:hypothetical protein C6A85_08860, partial [Mycobacterium sp. ITM-2017-0098]
MKYDVSSSAATRTPCPASRTCTQSFPVSRRREVSHPSPIVRGVVVDTAWFTGNYPPEVSVEAAFVDGYPTPEELAAKTE